MKRDMPGAIAKDIIKKYLYFENSGEFNNESELIEAVWNYWLTLNEKSIREKDGLEKTVRFRTEIRRNREKLIPN